MQRLIRQWLGPSLVSLAVLAGCAGDGAIGPDGSAGRGTSGGALARSKGPELGSCTDLKVEDGHRLHSTLYANGFQVYRWDGAVWAFVAPDAPLARHPDGREPVGTHYAGPTWESVSGSRVIGTVLKRCTPDANAIPWLLLGATKSDGPGIFRGTTFIQRLHTTGGLAPAQPGSFVGEMANVPYTTMYLFYRKG